MKYGVADYGMNVYDGVYHGAFLDLEDRLEKLQVLGFDGIERLEARDTAGVMQKAQTFHRLGMDFATVRGPQTEETVAWSCAFGREYVWLTPGEQGKNAVDWETFIRRANHFVDACAKYHLKAALHNHLGTMIETQEELDHFMKDCPGAALLLDIGHLAAAGGDVCRITECYFDRLAAVHFKDVFIKDETVGLDKWWDRLRFCELDGGNRPGQTDWKGVAEILKKRHFSKWVLVEHDTHLRDPFTDLKISIDLLKTVLE